MDESTAVEDQAPEVEPETLGDTLGELVPQEHGGALLRGRPKGFKGAGGRPPSASRAKNRELHHEAADELADMLKRHRAAKDDRTSPDQLSVNEVKNIHDSSGRYGIGTSTEYIMSDESGEALMLLIQVAARPPFNVDADALWAAYEDELK